MDLALVNPSISGREMEVDFALGAKSSALYDDTHVISASEAEEAEDLGDFEGAVEENQPLIRGRPSLESAKVRSNWIKLVTMFFDQYKKSLFPVKQLEMVIPKEG